MARGLCPGNVRKLLELGVNFDVGKWKHCWSRNATVEKQTVSAIEGNLRHYPNRGGGA